MDIHVGKLVLNKLKEKGMKKSEFARRINKSRQNVQDIFRRQSLDTHLLLDISKVLDYNFFEILSGQLDSSPMFMEDQATYGTSKSEKQKLKSQLQSLSKQVKLANREISYLKKINSLQEKKLENTSSKKKEPSKK